MLMKMERFKYFLKGMSPLMCAVQTFKMKYMNVEKMIRQLF